MSKPHLHISAILASLLVVILPVVAMSQAASSVLVTNADTSSLPQVSVYVSALDGEGKPMAGLDKSSFEVTEDGTSQQISEVSKATESASIVLAMDTSGSMAEGRAGAQAIDRARDAAQRFVETMRKSSESDKTQPDQIALFSFNEKPALRSGFTRDSDSIMAAIKGLQAEQKWTALYDASFEAIKLAGSVQQGRCGVLLFTDGQDEGPDGRAGSTMKFDDVIKQSREGNVPVFVVGLGNQINVQDLTRLATLTGGQFYRAPEATMLVPIFEQIATQLKTQYRIQYRSSGVAGDHSVQVRMQKDKSEAVGTRTLRFPAVPPTFSIASPAKGAQVTGDVDFAIKFEGYLQQPISKAEYWIDSQQVGVSSVAPFGFKWSTSGIKPGEHTVEVKIFDTAGQMVSQKGTVVVAPVEIKPTPTVPVPTPAPTVPAPTVAPVPTVAPATSGSGDLIPILAGVVGLIVLVAVGGGAFFFVKRRRAAVLAAQEVVRSQQVSDAETAAVVAARISKLGPATYINWKEPEAVADEPPAGPVELHEEVDQTVAEEALETLPELPDVEDEPDPEEDLEEVGQKLAFETDLPFEDEDAAAVRASKFGAELVDGTQPQSPAAQSGRRPSTVGLFRKQKAKKELEALRKSIAVKQTEIDENEKEFRKAWGKKWTYIQTQRVAQETAGEGGATPPLDAPTDALGAVFEIRRRAALGDYRRSRKDIAELRAQEITLLRELGEEMPASS